MIVKARTVYTKELKVECARFINVKSSMQNSVWIFVELAILAYIAYIILDAVAREQLEDIGFELVTPLIFLFMLPFIVFVIPALSVRFIRHPFDVVNTYEFTEHEMIVESILQKATAQIRIANTQFEKVYDTKDFFYLFISRREAFIVRKSDIFVGSVSDLQNIFRRNIPENKYMVEGV